MNIAAHLGHQYKIVASFDTNFLDLRFPCRAEWDIESQPQLPTSDFSPAATLAIDMMELVWQLDNAAIERIAGNSLTPAGLLTNLATHPCADVRAAVSDNASTPLTTLWTLCQDEDADVRYQLAENHNLPLELINALMSDENPYVACRAQRTWDRMRSN